MSREERHAASADMERVVARAIEERVSKVAAPWWTLRPSLGPR